MRERRPGRAPARAAGGGRALARPRSRARLGGVCGRRGGAPVAGRAATSAAGDRRGRCGCRAARRATRGDRAARARVHPRGQEEEVKALVAARRRAGRSGRWRTSRRGRGGAAVAGPARVGGGVRLADRRLVRARAAHGAVAARGGGAGGADARGDAAVAAARGAGRAGAAAAHAVGVDDRRLRDDRADARAASDEAAAARRCRPGTVSIGDLARLPHDTPVRARRAGRRAPAAGHGEGDRVPAARGRVRDDQPDRAAGPL